MVILIFLDFGMSETNRQTDFLSIININSCYSWENLTRLIDQTFEKECLVLLNDEQGKNSTKESCFL